jgi:hypothetical protein
MILFSFSWVVIARVRFAEGVIVIFLKILFYFRRKKGLLRLTKGVFLCGFNPGLNVFLVTPPSQRVHFILGEDAGDDESHESHPLFSEMEELVIGDGDVPEWKETAR